MQVKCRDHLHFILLVAGLTVAAAIQQPCGELGQACCCDVNTGFTGECCSGPDLFCHTFAPAPNATAGDPQPTLCMPVPEGCGANGAACCPGNATAVYNPHPCTDLKAFCRQTYYDSDYSDYEAYLDDIYSMSNESFGICTLVPVDKCGQAGGPCGDFVMASGVECPEDKRECPEGYYCGSVYDTNAGYPMCLEVPPNCGELDNKCCPPENSTGVPYCYNETVYCSAPQSSVEYSECLHLPEFPDECGGEGKPCCPSGYHTATDKPLPEDICMVGAYCDGYPPNGTCIMNPLDCGLEGKPCCKMTTPSTTALGCRVEGLYCPFGEDNLSPVCTKCPDPIPDDLQWQCSQSMQEIWNVTFPPEFAKP